MRFVHFIELLLLFGVLMLVGIPLFRGLSGLRLFAARDKLGEEYRHLLVRKEEVLLSIKDLEFDLKTSKVSEEDYADLRHRLEMEAASILEKLDSLEKEKKASRKDSKHAVV